MGKLSSIALFEFSMVRVKTFYKIPPYLPFTKGGVIPLFGKVGRGEILRCMSIQFSDPYYHVYDLLSPFNRVIIPFRDPINCSMIQFVPIRHLALFRDTEFSFAFSNPLEPASKLDS